MATLVIEPNGQVVMMLMHHVESDRLGSILTSDRTYVPNVNLPEDYDSNIIYMYDTEAEVMYAAGEMDSVAGETRSPEVPTE